MKRSYPLIACFLFIPYLSFAQVLQAWVVSCGNNPLIAYTTTQMALDNTGNVYLAGYGRDTAGQVSSVILKYNGAGILQWFDSIPQSGYFPALAIDRGGNALICTVASNALGGEDYLIIKYNQNGDTLWTRRFSGLEQGTNYPSSITVDDSSNVYVTGKVTTDSSSGFATLKYSPNGTLYWVSEYLTGYFGDAANAITTDSLHNVYITGNALDSSQMVTIKYNASGLQQWVRKYNYGAGQYLSVFNNQYLFAGGVVDSFSGSSYFLVIKYDLDGNEIWSTNYNSQDSLGTPTPEANDASVMKVDRTGNVYIAGSQNTYTADMAYSMVKISSNGKVEWAKWYRGNDVNGWNRITSLCVDGSGKVYVTGYVSDTIYPAIETIIYDSDGNTLDMIDFATGIYEDNNAARIALDSANNIYIAISGFYGTGNIILAKYGTVNSIGSFTYASQLRLQLHPNPFTTQSTVQYSIPDGSKNASLIIYDMLGRERSSYPLNNSTGEITINANNLSSGVYLYTLVVDGRVLVTKKMVVEE